MNDSETIKRYFYKGNYEAIREELQAVNWESIEDLNVEDSWNFFITKINNVIDRHVPQKS